jgi:hypothetical protein
VQHRWGSWLKQDGSDASEQTGGGCKQAGEADADEEAGCCRHKHHHHEQEGADADSGKQEQVGLLLWLACQGKPSVNNVVRSLSAVGCVHVLAAWLYACCHVLQCSIASPALSELASHNLPHLPCCCVLCAQDSYRASKPSSRRGSSKAAAAAGKATKASGGSSRAAGSKRKAAEAVEQQPQDSAAADDEDDTMTAADVGMSAEDAPLLSSQDTSGKLSRCAG